MNAKQAFGGHVAGGARSLCLWRRGRIGWKDAYPAPFLLISALASAWTIWEQKFHASAVGPEWAQTWPERLIIADEGCGFTGQTILASSLSFIYPRWEIIHRSGWPIYPYWQQQLVWSCCGCCPERRGRAAFFAGRLLCDLTVPILGFLACTSFRLLVLSDHFQYLASMGTLALSPHDEGFRGWFACVACRLPYFCGWYFAAACCFWLQLYMQQSALTTTHNFVHNDNRK